MLGGPGSTVALWVAEDAVGNDPSTGCPTTGPPERETMWKRVGAVGLVAALIGVGAVVLSGGRRSPRPTGTIAYSGARLRDVFVARADGSRVRRLTSAPGPQFDPSFSPDGRLIAYRDSRHGINEDDEVWVMDRDGGHARTSRAIMATTGRRRGRLTGGRSRSRRRARARSNSGRWPLTARAPRACRGRPPSTPRVRRTGRGSPSRS